MSAHTVASFDEELGGIERLIGAMGDLARSMVASATSALVNSDAASAQRVIFDDSVMDARQRDVDDRSIALIARRQPVAQDLRSAVGAMRMAGDLERIGDLAKNIAKRVDAVGQSAAPRQFAHGIEAMAGLVLSQVERVVNAYGARNPEALRALRTDDEKVDVQYTAVFRELLTYMMEDPRNITACTHLLFCAKNLERIGDHVTNIAENAYYVVTGAQLPLERPKHDEMTSTDDGL